MTEQIVSIERMEDAVDIFGSFDENIRLIEQGLGGRVVGRGGINETVFPRPCFRIQLIHRHFFLAWNIALFIYTFDCQCYILIIADGYLYRTVMVACIRFFVVCKDTGCHTSGNKCSRCHTCNHLCL